VGGSYLPTPRPDQFNLDFIWTIALVATGLILFATARY